MRFPRRHPPDERLILAADNALPRYRQAIVDRHLRRCPACRARVRALNQLFADTVQAYRDCAPATPLSTEALRTRLHDHMTTLSTTWGQSWSVRLRRRANSLPVPMRVGVPLLLVFAVVVLSARVTTRPALKQAGTAFAGVLPIRALTPGAVADLDARALCTAGVAPRRPVAQAVREAVVRDYGMAEIGPHEYELDYLITPELGGTPDPKNLWPERYDSAVWNARVKDDLERLLPQMVCDGRLDLRTAQRDIAENWIAAYQKYFHTEHPLPSQAGLRDDDDDADAQIRRPIVLVEALDTNLPIAIRLASRTTAPVP